MVQGRAAGNGKFDIDAITRLVNADANAPALIEQPFIDPVADAFAADVDDMVDELRFNPSSNLAEEAQQIMNSPLAAKLGAGVMADLRAAVQLQEEKAANGSDAFMRGDRVWEEREKREERDRKDKADNAKFAEDANDASQLSTTPDRYGLSEQNYADLNNDLKSRDGQERFMNFMRMMYPNLTDAEIKQRYDDAKIIAAVRGGTATDKEKKDYDGMSTERKESGSRALQGYKQWEGSGLNSEARATVAPSPTAYNGTVDAGARAFMKQDAIIASVEPATPVIVARDETIAARAPDATSAFNAVAPNTIAAPAPQPNRVADLQLAAARAPAADQSMGI